ncbi:MAG: glutaredoxin domain-containing protein [Patescibacteria group bacterium]|nr:glutaredoxin domain-containing protein [Patescibacteria group bacterium]
MNLAYFRKSNRDYEATKNELVRRAEQEGWKNLGSTDFPDDAGAMVLVCRPDWIKELLTTDRNLVGFLPCGISILRKGNEVFIGTGQTGILKAMLHDPNLAWLAAEADQKIKELIHGAADVGPPKPTGVRLYSSTTCPYCTMEKSWLDQNKVEHEVVMVDQDQEAAQEMVKKTGQMGVPVTEIRYEDDEPEYILGFDRDRLGQILGVDKK